METNCMQNFYLKIVYEKPTWNRRQFCWNYLKPSRSRLPARSCCWRWTPAPTWTRWSRSPPSSSPPQDHSAPAPSVPNHDMSKRVRSSKSVVSRHVKPPASQAYYGTFHNLEKRKRKSQNIKLGRKKKPGTDRKEYMLYYYIRYRYRYGPVFWIRKFLGLQDPDQR
jgi:hypothetical protein